MPQSEEANTRTRLRKYALGAWSRLPRVFVLLAALLALAWWQHGFLDDAAQIESAHVVTAPSGIDAESTFFFFLYHLNLFPVASDTVPTQDTREEAQRLMREYPQQLRQDIGTTFRAGHRGRTYLYFVDALIHHRGRNLTIHPAHAIAFIIALGALLTSFWAMKRTASGVLLVIVLGSNPFQLFSIYRQENVFSWAITCLAATLAIQLPLLERGGFKWRFYPWVAAVSTGLVFAFALNFRSEPTILLVSPALVYLTATHLSRRTRLALVLVLATSFSLGSRASNAFIDWKLQQSGVAVGRAGGTPYSGPVSHFHEFWHVMFCGLGDFGKDRDYEWNDRTAFRYAYPELSRLNPGVDIQLVAPQTRSWDGKGMYPIYYFEIPHYHDIIRDKVMGDIVKHPLWYLHILRLRATRTLSVPTPVGIALPSRYFYLDGSLLAWASLPLMVFLAIRRRWAYLKMILFAAPLSILPLFVYSGGGMTNYSTFHAMGAWVFAMLILEGARVTRRRRRALRLLA